MLLRNKEMKVAVGLFGLLGVLSGALGFLHTWETGLGVLLCWTLCVALFLTVERKRYERLRKISEDLDALLLHGRDLPIEDYEEGELSVLAHQVQKLTHMLTEARDVVQRERNFLADSLADISHQLRTPLTAMHLTLSLLREPEQEAGKHRELLREFRGLLHRTQWLVEALLKLSKLDAGTIRFRREAVSLQGLLERSLAPFAIAMELQEQRLELRCEDCTVYCDPVWTVEAIGNVLKNAIEHNPAGAVIYLTGRDTPIFTEITVEDQGGGFLPEDLPRIFERFYRGKDEDSKNCGIGLSLCRSILSAQDGSITAENHGKGAKFTIKLYKQPV